MAPNIIEKAGKVKPPGQESEVKPILGVLIQKRKDNVLEYWFKPALFSIFTKTILYAHRKRPRW